MSLVGSLEDLNLGDILQIISLSQKSGVLALRTSDGGGCIVFVNGLVRGAAVKGGPRDLRAVLVGGGFIDEDGIEAAERSALSEGVALAEAVVRVTSISSERLQSLCREAVEAAVVTMFSWQRGEFSFDVRTEFEPDDPELLLPTGINAQYLAMEGARLSDEADQYTELARAPKRVTDEGVAGVGAGESPESFAGLAEAAGEEDPPTPAPVRARAVDRLAEAILARVDDARDERLGDRFEDPDEEPAGLSEVMEVTWEADEPVLQAELLAGEPLDLVEGVVIHEAADTAAPAAASEPDAELIGRPLVAIDEDLTALEWVKKAVARDFARIHIFQRSDLGLARIRQYLMRGEIPLVLISPRTQVDPLSGIRGSEDFVRRLKAQSTRITVVWLCEEGTDAPPDAGAADGFVSRPVSKLLRPSKGIDKLAPLSAAFRQSLLAALAGAVVGKSERGPRSEASRVEGAGFSPDNLRHLRDATRLLSDASSRGDVLPLVMRFAAESFERIAMFMVRDGTAVGMAQAGLSRCGGPNDEALRQISLATTESEWLRAILEDRRPVLAAPSSAGDRELAGLLGNRVPAVAYLAPIESAGQVIAFLYADNLPSGGPIGDTSGLEVVLHHAGLALDRAALERVLRESGSADA